MAWLWWMGGAALLAVVEVLSLDLVLIMFAGGAVAGGIAAAFGAPLSVQVLVAAVSSVVLLTTLRPLLLRHLRDRVPLQETNVAALVGRPALALSAVDADGGRVKIHGEVWSARLDGPGELPADAPAVVLRIEGATAVVAPDPRRGTS
ncbi:NfeD family protein [Cellulomonas marina]|uniref:Membrane protein implicated in regulation of membrane protease activity n=1 Tax=Cellulomonas marina TaxID=988821 RepID=A0A1I0ZRF0_9CELL|nr:NfeD family protein [Cellulomonas marina]SFB28235.1 Membrane protein implicated in regulation of membrane protease activity [Cellulomonas marina]